MDPKIVFRSLQREFQEYVSLRYLLPLLNQAKILTDSEYQDLTDRSQGHGARSTFLTKVLQRRGRSCPGTVLCCLRAEKIHPGHAHLAEVVERFLISCHEQTQSITKGSPVAGQLPRHGRHCVAINSSTEHSIRDLASSDRPRTSSSVRVGMLLHDGLQLQQHPLPVQTQLQTLRNCVQQSVGSMTSILRQSGCRVATDQPSQSRRAQSMGKSEPPSEYVTDQESQSRRAQWMGKSEPPNEYVTDQPSQSRRAQSMGKSEPSEYVTDQPSQSRKVQSMGKSEPPSEYVTDQESQSRKVQSMGKSEPSSVTEAACEEQLSYYYYQLELEDDYYKRKKKKRRHEKERSEDQGIATDKYYYQLELEDDYYCQLDLEDDDYYQLDLEDDDYYQWELEDDYYYQLELEDDQLELEDNYYRRKKKKRRHGKKRSEDQGIATDNYYYYDQLELDNYRKTEQQVGTTYRFPPLPTTHDQTIFPRNCTAAIASYPGRPGYEATAANLHHFIKWGVLSEWFKK